MSSVKALLPKLTSSNKKWRQPKWNEVSAKGDSRQPKLTGMFTASALAKQGHDTSKTKYKEIYFAKHDSNTVVNVGIHSDKERGVTGLGYQGCYLTRVPL